MSLPSAIRIPALLLMSAASICAVTQDARAQAQRQAQGKQVIRPAVEVDTSVLSGMPRQLEGRTALQAPKLSNPVISATGRLTEPDGLVAPMQAQTQTRPLLTAPMLTGDGPMVAAAPAKKQGQKQAAKAQEKKQDVATMASVPVPPRKPQRETEAPVKVAEKAAPAPAVKVEAVAEEEEVVSLTEPTSTFKAPPVPPKRPSIQQASSDFVEKAREKIKKIGYEVRQSPSAPVMPARPAGKVAVETIYDPKNADEEDAFLASMMDMDKAQVMAGINDVAKRTEKAPAIPLKSAAAEKTKAQSTEKEKVAAKPAIPPRPEAAKMAEIAPAAGAALNNEVIKAKPIEKNIRSASLGKTPRLPPQQDYAGSDYISMPFSKGEDVALDDGMKNLILNEVVPALKDGRTSLQLQSFASDAGSSGQSARRTSLSRALAIRSFLIEQGVDAHRLDIRAQGLQTDRNPLDRVDFVFIRDDAA